MENLVFASLPGRWWASKERKVCNYLPCSQWSDQRIVNANHAVEAVDDKSFDIAKCIYRAAEMATVMNERVGGCTTIG